MKTWLFSALVVLLMCTAETEAQFIKQYGFKVAFTSADQEYNLAPVPDLETKRRSGVNVAGFLELFDLPVFSLITQVEYAQRGMGVEFAVTSPSGPEPIGMTTLYSRVDYLSIPVLVKARLETEAVSPYIMAGPRFDVMLGYKSDKDAFNLLYDEFKKTNWGASVGAGVESDAVLPFVVSAEFRYNFDFADSYRSDLANVRNNAFDVWVGFGF